MSIAQRYGGEPFVRLSAAPALDQFGRTCRTGIRTLPARAEKAIDTAFIRDVLRPYRPDARYLKSASVTACGEFGGDSPFGSSAILSGAGQFEISESCYIDDTGHFNAVEFNICFNQLAYVLFGKAIACELSDALSFLSFEQFKRSQLSSWLIVSIEGIRFSKQLRPSRFQGALSLNSTSINRGTRFFFTSIQFFDDEGVKATGSVVLAYTGDAF